MSIAHIDYLIHELGAIHTALKDTLACAETELTAAQRSAAYEVLGHLRETVDAHNPELVALQTGAQIVLTLLAEAWSGETLLTLED